MLALTLLAAIALHLPGQLAPDGSSKVDDTPSQVDRAPPPVEVPPEANGDKNPADGAPDAAPDAKGGDTKQKPNGKGGAEKDGPRKGDKGEGADKDDDRWLSPLLVGSAAGCGVGGVTPAAGVVGGYSMFYSSLAASVGAEPCATTAGAALGAMGVVLSVPMVLMLGPCAAGGAMCGGLVAAVFSGKDLWSVVTWSIPGLVMGLLGGGVAAGGLVLSTNNDPALRDVAMPAGTALVVIGTAAAVLAGPTAITTLTLFAEDAGDNETEEVRKGGVDALAPAAPPQQASQAAMAF